MTQGSSTTQATTQAQALRYGNLLRQSSMLAFIDAFWLLGLTFIGMIPLMFLLKKAKHHTSGPVAAH
jgi:MFS transporter, DHA2 family, multidrug resistance protein